MTPSSPREADIVRSPGPPTLPAASTAIGIGAPLHPSGTTLRDTLTILWRRRVTIVLTVLLAGMLGILFATSLEPRYTATARMIFEPERLRIIDLDNVVANPDPAPVALQNQIEVLRSAIVLDRVAAMLALANAPEFRVERRMGYAETLIAPLHAAGLVQPRLPSAPESAERQRRQVVQALMDGLRIRPVGASRVIEVNYTGPDPELAAQIANATAEQYIILQTERRRDDAARASELLGGRVRDLEHRLQRAEEAVQLAELELITGAAQGSATIASQLETLNHALAEAALARTTVEERSRRAHLALLDDGDLHANPDFRASAIVASYRGRELELLEQEVSMRSLVSSASNPERVRLGARLAEVRRTIREEAGRIAAALDAESEAAATREVALAQQLAELQRRAGDQARSEMRLARLERDAQAIRSIYETFLTRMNETAEQVALQSPDALILTRASAPDGADSRGRLLIALGAIAVGAAAGSGLAFASERLDQSVRRGSDLEALTGLGLLAGIPRIAGAGDAGRIIPSLLRVRPKLNPRQVLNSVTQAPAGHLAESMRNLRTSLHYTNLDQAPKVVVFASSLPGEGKTTTAILAAVAGRQVGRSAIVVDCDLRRRAVAPAFDVTPEGPGLLAMLEGYAAPETAILEDRGTGVHLLLPERTGPAVANPADILASRRFARLIGQLRARYDLIVLDVPPVLAVADARIVAPLADAVVYLVRWNSTAQTAVREGVRELRSVDAKLAGAVFTLIDERQARGYLDCDFLYKSAYR